MPLFYDTAGIPIQIATPQVNYGALANVRPLSFGQNPLQFQAGAAWSVPEPKPYIAQGIGQALSGIGQGMLEARKAAHEKERQKAIDDREIEKERKRNEREDARNIARDAIEQKREDARLKIEREKITSQETIARMKAVGITPPGDENVPISMRQKPSEDAVDAISKPIAATDVVGKKADLTTSPDLEDLSLAYIQKPDTSGLAEFNKKALEIGIPTAGKKLGFNFFNMETPVTAPAPVAPAAVPAPIQTPPAPIQAPTPLVVAPAVVPTSTPAPVMPSKGDIFTTSKIAPSKNVLSGSENVASAPALGTENASNYKPEVKAVKDTPELGTLADVEYDPRKIKTPINLDPSKFQQVDPRDVVVEFGSNGKNAIRQAMDFNEKYPNSRFKASAEKPTDKKPYWSVNYEDVSRERIAARESSAAHRSAEESKKQGLEFRKELRVGNMAKAYESQPKTKLMSTREDAMGRMLVAYENRKNAKSDTAKSTIDQELKELFVMFASGKAPTEAQFKEISHAFPGAPEWLTKKIEFWKSGATLTEPQVETIKNLMLETYNNSARQVNSSLSDISDILKKEHPNIDPRKLPVNHPILETEDVLRKEGEKLQEELRKHPEKKDELKPIAAEIVKKIEFFRTHGIPSNLHEIQNPAKTPGFHSYLFSPSPDLSFGQLLDQ